MKNVSVAAAAIPQPVPAVARPETANLSGVDSTPVAPAVNETKNKPVESQPKQKAQADTEKTPVKPAPSPSEIAQASAKPASKKPETKKPAPVAGSASKSASANKKALTAVDANGARILLRVSTSWELSSVRMRRKRLLLRRSRQRSRTPQAKLKTGSERCFQGCQCPLEGEEEPQEAPLALSRHHLGRRELGIMYPWFSPPYVYPLRWKRHRGREKVRKIEGFLPFKW